MKYPNLSADLMQNLAALYALNITKSIEEYTQGEYKVLQYLATNRGQEVLPSMLSDALGLTTARIAATLNTLEKKALVQRKPSREDKRKVLVIATPEGILRVELKRKAIGKALSALVAGIGKKEAKELNRLLGELIKQAR